MSHHSTVTPADLNLADLQSTIPNPPHSNTPFASVALSLYVAPQCVGTLIGRGGKTINSIMREAGRVSLNPSVWVKILEKEKYSSSNRLQQSASAIDNSSSYNGYSIEQSGEDDKQEKEQEDEDDWTRVLIRGDAVGVFAAARLIVKLLSNHTSASNGTVSNGKGYNHNHQTANHQNNNDNQNGSQSDIEIDYIIDPDVVLDVPLNRYRQHGAVVGKRGATIAALSADHNVRIFVPHKQTIYDGNDNSSTMGRDANVQLEGSLDNVEKCLVQMLAIVAGRMKGNSIPPVLIHDDDVATRLASSSPYFHHNNQYQNHFQSQQYNQQSQVQTSKTRQNVPRETIKNDSVITTPAQSQLTMQSADAKFCNKQESKKKEDKGEIDESLHSSDGKSGQTTVIMAPSNAMVPSLAQLRVIGKKTGTIIRRKRVQIDCAQSSEEVAETVSCKANDDEVESTTEFSVTGRSEMLKVVQKLFDRIFSGEPVDSVIESVPKRNTNKYRRKKGNKTDKKSELKEKGESKSL